MKERGAVAAASLFALGLQMSGQPPALRNEFFALDTAMVKNLGKEFIQKSDVETLATLGYRGVAVVVPTAAAWRHLTEKVIPWLDEKQLKLYAVYSGGRVGHGEYTIDPELKPNLRHLAGRGTAIWLSITSREFKPSDPAADVMAVALVREAAAAAAAHGLTVSLYPHWNNWLERTSDAVRVAEKTGRTDVGVTLNLCHWLRVEGADSMEATIRLARPRLSIVTINGANRDGKEWIQPLDSGDFDAAAFLRTLYRLDYRGPIGLQGFAVANTYQIEPAENLRRSMAAWKKLSRLAASGDARGALD